MVGMQVEGIAVGAGGAVANGRFFGRFLRLGEHPIHGLTYLHHNTERFWRLRQIASVGAGPLVSAALFLATLKLLVFAEKASVASPEPWSKAASPLLLVLLLVQGLIVIGNLWPHMTTIEGKQAPNDGSLLIQALTKTRNEILAAIVASYIAIEQRQAAGGSPTDSERFWQRSLQRYPRSQALRIARASSLCRGGKFAQAKEVWLKELAAPDLSSERRAEVLDGWCCIPLYWDCPDYLPEADAWSKEALELRPREFTLKGTRGAVLIELGRIEEGKALLREVLEKSSDANDRSISLAYLELAASKQDDQKAAEEMLARAKKESPHCPVLEKITKKVASRE